MFSFFLTIWHFQYETLATYNLFAMTPPVLLRHTLHKYFPGVRLTLCYEPSEKQNRRNPEISQFAAWYVQLFLPVFYWVAHPLYHTRHPKKQDDSRICS